MKRPVKFIIGLLAFPVAIGVSQAFYEEILRLSYFNPKVHFFLWGLVAYLLMHVLIYKPFNVYIWGHEAIHVLAAWLSGGHVTSFNVSSHGGSVTTSKTNIFIELSPYFIPLYTLLLIFLMPVVRYRLTRMNWFSGYIFLIGFSIGMHLIMTATVMKTRQPDITKSGLVFSLVLIYISNLIIIFSLFALLTKELTLGAFLIKSLENSKEVYLFLWGKVSWRR